MSEIISYKNKQPSLNQKKYITLETESLDYTKMSNILHTQGIEISKQTIESVFEKHNYHKNRLINEICDNIGNKNEKNTLLTQILTNELQLNIWSERQKFLDLILHRYINKQELNDDDFIKILIYTAVDLYPEINVSEIKQIATSNEVNMAVFMKSKNSTKFGKLFNSMTIFKKKQWAKIYISIKKWNAKTYVKLTQSKTEQKHDDIVNSIQPLHETISYLEQDSSNQDTLNLFCAITNLNINQKTAQAFLIATDWNIDAAIEKYYALSGNISLLGPNYAAYNDSKNDD
eukprot:80969_1